MSEKDQFMKRMDAFILKQVNPKLSMEQVKDELKILTALERAATENLNNLAAVYLELAKYRTHLENVQQKFQYELDIQKAKEEQYAEDEKELLRIQNSYWKLQARYEELQKEKNKLEKQVRRLKAEREESVCRKKSPKSDLFTFTPVNNLSYRRHLNSSESSMEEYLEPFSLKTFKK